MPGIAAEFGLRVTVGAWIDKHEERNEREIRSVIDLAHRHSNVNSIIVGNETIYRGDQTVPELIKKIQRVKRATNVPVTTGEIWNVWIEHPELVSAVDYIAAHILPYWEGFSDKQAVDQAILIYDKLREAYPGKRIVIAEFGWPSAGYNLKNADPGRIEQAAVLRDFVSARRRLRHRLQHRRSHRPAVEDLRRRRRSLLGPVRRLAPAEIRLDRPDHRSRSLEARRHRAAGERAAVAADPGHDLGDAAAGGAARRRRQCRRRLVGRRCSPSGTDIISCPAPPSRSASAPLLLIPLIIIALARIDEIAAIAFGRKPLRLIAAPPLAPEAAAPKVSIHIPAYNEPPEMLKQTLDAVARLDYPNFECVVVINNTPDPALWRPVEEHCRSARRALQVRQRRQAAGFKAGALRLAHGAHRRRRRDHRRHRRRLRRAARLAQGPGAAVCRSARRPGPGAAGSPRRRAQPHALTP